MAGDLPGKKSPPCTSQPCIGSVYMALYNASAISVKAVDKSLQVTWCIGIVWGACATALATTPQWLDLTCLSALQVGGPATEHLNTQNFLSQAKAMHAPVDFVSSHNYPTGPRGDGSGCLQGSAQWYPQVNLRRDPYARLVNTSVCVDICVVHPYTQVSTPNRSPLSCPQCFFDSVMAARAETAELPFLLTEYSVMVGEGMAAAGQRGIAAGSAAGTAAGGGTGTRTGRSGEPPFQHDGPGSAAFVFRMVPQVKNIERSLLCIA